MVSSAVPSSRRKSLTRSGCLRCTLCPIEARAGLAALALRRSGDLRLDLLDRFDVGFDVHAVTDHHPAGLQHLVPREPEVLAIDRRLRGERRAHVTPWVLGLAVLFDTEDDLASVSPDREITHDVDLGPGSRLDAPPDEAQFGV